MRRSGKGTHKKSRGDDAYASGISAIQSVIDDPQLVDRRRAQIVAAATKCFSRGGYHGTTIKDICKEGGVSPGLVYQYVKDKHDLLFLTLMHVVNENKNKIPPAIQSTQDPIVRFVAVFRTLTRVVDENRPAVMLTYREGHSLSLEYREALKRLELEHAAMISEVIDDCITAGQFEPMNADLLTFHMLIVAQGWATKYWHFRDLISIEDYIEQNLSLLLNSALSAQGRRDYGNLMRSGGTNGTRPSKR